MALAFRFLSNESGSLVERFALTASVIALLGVTGANHLARSLDKSREARLAAAEQAQASANGANPNIPVFDNIDPAMTASIASNARPLILNPCTGRIE